MAVPEAVQKEIKDLLDPANTCGVHVKLEKILQSLEKFGLVYKAVVFPREILCHPDNRGTSMCNAGVEEWAEERPFATQFFGDRACSGQCRQEKAVGGQ